MARLGIATICIALLLQGCSAEKPIAPASSTATSAKATVTLTPGPEAQKKVQEALIKAKKGDVIELAAGRFDFTMGLSCSVAGVTIRGKGMDRTILSFRGQNAGSEGLGAKHTDGLVLEDFSVENTKGDAIKITESRGVTFRRVRVAWTNGGRETNGAYGLYPVQCTDVLMEDCVAIGASDAGVYVGQSNNVIVRRCKAHQNVVGIEIENTKGADLHDCEVTDNACGLFVTDLPNLQVKNGGQCRVFHNRVYANNHPNFGAKGNIVALMPPGTGLMILAMDKVEVFENEFEANQTCNLCILSYFMTGKPIKDDQYDPIPEGVYVHDNRFIGGGDNPTGSMAQLMGPILGKPFPDIVYDGIINAKKAAGGKLPSDLMLVIKDNGSATFANARFDQRDMANPTAKKVAVERDLKPYAGPGAPLPAIQIAATP